VIDVARARATKEIPPTLTIAISDDGVLRGSAAETGTVARKARGFPES